MPHFQLVHENGKQDVSISPREKNTAHWHVGDAILAAVLHLGRQAVTTFSLALARLLARGELLVRVVLGLLF